MVTFVRRCAWFFVLLLAACSSVAPEGQAGRFYTEIDASGRARVVDMPAAPSSTAKSVSETGFQEPASNMRDASEQMAASVGHVQSYRSDVFAPDAEFVDSGWLEGRNFNPEEKKKFAWVPDGTGQMRPMFFSEGDGELKIDEKAAISFRQHELRWASLLPQENWPASQSFQVAALPEMDVLKAQYAYRPAQFCKDNKACNIFGLRFDWSLQSSKASKVLRMRSYLSQPSCPLCVQWPEVVILGADNKVLRIYAAELKGIKPASWRSYASVYQDIDVNPETDVGIVLLMPVAADLEGNGKKYRNVSNGEISFTWIQ